MMTGLSHGHTVAPLSCLEYMSKPRREWRRGLGGGAPDRIRTCDLLLRRQTLYPLSYRGPRRDCTSVPVPERTRRETCDMSHDARQPLGSLVIRPAR